MRTVLIAVILVFQPLVALSAGLSSDPVGISPPQVVPDLDRAGDTPSAMREGGESFGDAVVIPAIPYYDSGYTCNNVDNVTLPCAESAAPDVVYRYTPTVSEMICVILCGSSYDTALGIYDASLNCIACNDDFCDLQSQLVVSLVAGQTYYFVVDGYGTNCGNYTFRTDLGCLQPGACCFPDGSCQVLDVYICFVENGVYQGIGTLCEPNPCIPTPVEVTTWGRIKARFR